MAVTVTTARPPPSRRLFSPRCVREAGCDESCGGSDSPGDGCGPRTDSLLPQTPTQTQHRVPTCTSASAPSSLLLLGPSASTILPLTRTHTRTRTHTHTHTHHIHTHKDTYTEDCSISGLLCHYTVKSGLETGSHPFMPY